MSFEDNKIKAANEDMREMKQIDSPDSFTQNSLLISRAAFIRGADWTKQELGWQPIETAPQIEGLKLLFLTSFKDEVVIGEYWEDQDKWADRDGEDIAERVSILKWANFPEIPSANEAETHSEVTK